jgi:endonuclease G
MIDVSRILASDDELRKEIETKFKGLQREQGGRALESMTEGRSPGGFSPFEAIVLLHGRPVLFVKQNTFEVPTLDTWAERLEKARAFLLRAIPSVGRIEFRNQPDYDWGGTGWLVRDDIIVTNRHVANLVAVSDGSGKFVMRTNPLGKVMGASIDFREEYLQPEEEEFKVARVLFIAPDPGPDIAFLQLAAAPNRPWIPLSTSETESQDVATIGYPASDGMRNPGPDMDRIFGGVYDVKRLAPGAITSVTSEWLSHDCTTLGGNSGSAVLSLATGEAVGLHFSGTFQKSNFAVPAVTVAEMLKQATA